MARVGDELPHPVFGPEGTSLAFRARLVRGLYPAQHRVESISHAANLGVA